MTPLKASLGPQRVVPQPLPEHLDFTNYDLIVTEDNAPLESVFHGQQQRLLVGSLYGSWGGPGEQRPFFATSNVGLFFAANEPPQVPDLLLSLDVRPGANLHLKRNSAYFVWVFGKPPDLVIEVVSDREGGEDDEKLKTYAHNGVPYYVIFDPDDLLKGGVLRAFELHDGQYQPMDAGWFENIGLGLVLWDGKFERMTECWLRWCDRDGRLVLTGAERADYETTRANQAAARADQLKALADRLEARANQLASQADKLVEKFRALDVEPNAAK